jgi:hypothetical protein
LPVAHNTGDDDKRHLYQWHDADPGAVEQPMLVMVYDGSGYFTFENA